MTCISLICLLKLESNGDGAVGEKQCLSSTTVKSNKDAEAIVSNNKEKEQNDDKWDNMTTDPQTQVGII